MHRARNTSQKRANPYDGSHGEKGGRYDIGQMAADDRVVHDRIGVGVPVRVFVGSAGENAYRIVRNGDQHHLDGVHRHYVVSILLAKDKKAWFKGNLLMLVSIALPVFRPLRLLRLVAVLNVLNRTGGMAVRGRITLYTCCSVTLLMYIGALAELDVERGVPGASITDFGEAIWWSFVTVTTVGYGDLSPVTWQGRSIAIGLMITGVALIGIVTATLASWIVDCVRDETDKRADEAESETEQLRHNVRELTDTVNQLRDDIARLRRP